MVIGTLCCECRYVNELICICQYYITRFKYFKDKDMHYDMNADTGSTTRHIIPMNGDGLNISLQ